MVCILERGKRTETTRARAGVVEEEAEEVSTGENARGERKKRASETGRASQGRVEG